MPNIKCNNSGH